MIMPEEPTITHRITTPTIVNMLYVVPVIMLFATLISADNKVNSNDSAQP